MTRPASSSTSGRSPGRISLRSPLAFPRMPEFWKLVLEQAAWLVTRGPGPPSDRDRIACLLKELHVVGERPPSADLRAFLDERWSAMWVIDRRGIIDLWRRLERNPLHNFRVQRGGYPWVRPFVILDQTVEEHGLRSVGERLVEQAQGAQRRLLELALDGWTEDFDRAELEARETELAIRAWAASQSAQEGAFWPRHPFQPAGSLEAFARATPAGEARWQRRLQEQRLEYERQFPPG
jgi:hypothetical protein